MKEEKCNKNRWEAYVVHNGGFSEQWNLRLAQNSSSTLKELL